MYSARVDDDEEIVDDDEETVDDEDRGEETMAGKRTVERWRIRGRMRNRPPPPACTYRRDSE